MSTTEPTLGASERAPAQTRLEWFRRLADVFHEVSASSDLLGILNKIGDCLDELVPNDLLVVCSVDRSDDQVTPLLARGRKSQQAMEAQFHPGHGAIGWAIDNARPLVVEDARTDPRAALLPDDPGSSGSVITVPLIVRTEVLGVLGLLRSPGSAPFSDEEFELAIRCGDAASLAVEAERARRSLETDPHADALTGLHNHGFFQDRMKAELTRVGRSRDSVSLLLIDVDDFKQINESFGYSVGDRVLVGIAELIRSTVRASDVACRLGGEEFAVIMPSCDAGDALGLASRLSADLSRRDFGVAGMVSVSIGVAQGPDHAVTPRDLLDCAEAAVLSAKAMGKDRTVLYDDKDVSSSAAMSGTDVRSIAHLKMLQSVVGKLNRLTDVREIGLTIANELRTLIDYHSCLVYMRDGEELYPIAARGELAEVLDRDPQKLVRQVGVGIVGTAISRGKPLLIPNALECDFAVQVPGTPEIDESIIATPLSYGAYPLGAVVISKLGAGQFDEDDVRLLQVLAGHASIALENARLYEAQRREADNAKALLQFAEAVGQAESVPDITRLTVDSAARLCESTQSWISLQGERSERFRCVDHVGVVGDTSGEALLRRSMDQAAGASLIGDVREPRVAQPEDLEQLGLSVEVAGAVALAPLHGLPGWIVVRQPQADANFFTADRLRLLAGLSYQSSVAIQKARLYKAQKEDAEIASSLLGFSRELGAAEGIDEVLDRLVDQAARILGSPKLMVLIQEPGTTELVSKQWWGYDDEHNEALMNFRIAGPIAESLQESHEPFIVPTEMARELGGRTGDAELTYAVAPIRLEFGLGCILAAAPAFGTDYEFSERKIRLLSGIAYQAKLAIAHAGSFENLEATFLSTVEALANALEAKDEYTSSHARWITDMALEVGEMLGLELKTLKRLELGALFHDIGKIGIPSEILHKPGPLDDEEWEIIKLHPELGEKILAPIDRLADVRPIVRHCHEHFDGSGYPDGLIGDEIPIESRIILVVDAFHAMTSDRAYRNALPLDEACARLHWSAGSQFDPAVVNAFLKVIRAKPQLVDL